MRFWLTLVFVLAGSFAYNQHTHTKEIGIKGKVKKVTCLFYNEGVATTYGWAPKDSSRFTYKTVSFFNVNQNLDSMYTYVNHSGKEKLTTRKGYTYPKNAEMTGWEYDHMDDIRYNITFNWLDKSTYIEDASDASGKNRMRSKVYLDAQFHVIKREDELYRDGEIFDHSITETKFNPDNTEHAVSVTENKVSNLEYSQDEYIDQRDNHGNPIKKTYKNGVNSFRSIRYFIIEYYE